MNNLKKTFKNSDRISKNYSQSGQDLFVLMVTGGKENGTFIEIGAHEPIFISNTYLLESEFGWDGHLIEIDEDLCKRCVEKRTSEVICDDATKVNYNKLFEDKFIDYVSLDIDGFNSLVVLESIPINLNNTGIITFEHDSYRFTEELRNKSREIMNKKGFHMLCSDVANENNPFEDWYVNPTVYDIEELSILSSNNQNWDKIIFN